MCIRDRYYYLTELAAKCTAKRMVPDYISAKKMRELKGDVYTCMGCRSFLTPDRSYVKGNLATAGNYREGERKYYGRFNQGVVTVKDVYTRQGIQYPRCRAEVSLLF